MNFNVFLLPQSLTIPTESHDYPEWHKGREYYALWYLEVQHSELEDYLNNLRQCFAPYLLQPNTRQFHITLYICGFIIQNEAQITRDDDFSVQQLQQQLEKLTVQELKPFHLKTGKINSFNSALFIEIDDIQNSLSKIRNLFLETSNEIAALNYCPHITLGLYSNEFQANDIFKLVDSIDQRTFEIDIHSLTFGMYQANVLQGQLMKLKQFPLISEAVNTSQEPFSC